MLTSDRHPSAMSPPSTSPAPKEYDERSGLLVVANSPSSWGAVAGVDLASASTPTEAEGEPSEDDAEEEEKRLKGFRLYITLYVLRLNRRAFDPG